MALTFLTAGQFILIVLLVFLLNVAATIGAILLIKRPFADYLGKRIGRQISVGAEQYYQEKEQHIKRKPL